MDIMENVYKQIVDSMNQSFEEMWLETMIHTKKDFAKIVNGTIKNMDFNIANVLYKYKKNQLYNYDKKKYYEIQNLVIMGTVSGDC